MRHGGIPSSSSASSSVQPTVDTKHKTSYQWQRIKFTFTTKTRTKHLGELAFYNSKLQKLLESSDRLAGSRQSRGGRTQSQGSAKLTSFWRHAKTIYGLLRNAWRCECLPFHHANLLLQHWTDPEIELDIFFVFSRDAILRKIGPWKCQRTKITEIMKEVSTAANDLDDSSTITDLQLFDPWMPRGHEPPVFHLPPRRSRRRRRLLGNRNAGRSAQQKIFDKTHAQTTLFNRSNDCLLTPPVP